MEGPETRGRSRSNTPFLRSHCDHENCGEEGHEHTHEHKRRSGGKKSPTVNTIAEEHEESKVVGSKYDEKLSSHNEVKHIETKTVTTRTVSSRVGKSTPTSYLKTTVSSSSSSGGNSIRSKEVGQNVINNVLEKSLEYGSAKKNRSSVYRDNNDVDLSKHPSYKVYKDAGEYWNTYPKTDYTYSEVSPHRREIAPGFINMPNMSRRSLDKHEQRVTRMIERNPEKESFIRSRFESIKSRYASKSSAATKLNYENSYDSTDELDLSELNGKQWDVMYEQETIFTRFFKSIFSIITTITTSVFSVFRRSEKDYGYTRFDRYEKKGFLSRTTTTVANMFLRFFQWIYLGISSVLVFDTWLLQSKTRRNKKWFLLLLLLLLPLLLLTALLLSDEYDSSKKLLGLPLTIPVGLLALKESMYNWNFRNLFFFGGSETNTYINTAHLPDNFYNDLIAKIDLHIAGAINKKLDSFNNENLITNNKMIKNYIENIVVQNINTHSALKDEDYDRILALVQSKIGDWQTVPVGFTKEQIDEITNLIKQNINIYNINNSPGDQSSFDYNELLLRLTTSTALFDLIDGRLANSKIGRDEIAAIWSKLNEIQLDLAQNKEHSNRLEISISELHAGQTKFDDQFLIYKNDNAEQFKILLGDLKDRINILDTENKQFSAQLHEQVKVILLQLFGHGSDAGGMSILDLQNWIKSTFITKEYLETYLKQFEVSLQANINDATVKTEKNIVGVISDDVESRIKVAIEKNSQSANINVGGGGGAAVLSGEADIRRIVKEMLAVYDADKTGLVDYAMESAGGQVLSTRCTESFQTKSAQISILGIPLWYPTNTPRIAISPSVQPGDCWAFQGFPGFLVLQLNSPVYVTGFTIEHMPKVLAPNGKIDSAPKKFNVLGLQSEKDDYPYLFGNYEYLENSTALQFFPVKNIEENKIPYQIVELRIETNHGNPKYTCLYRFRVHGTPVKD